MSLPDPRSRFVGQDYRGFVASSLKGRDERIDVRRRGRYWSIIINDLKHQSEGYVHTVHDSGKDAFYQDVHYGEQVG